MSTDSTAATRSVTLEAADGSSITVDIRNASPVTQALRKKVEHFLRSTLVIWKEQPPQDTGLIATPAVVDEVVRCATAFHANEQDTVDLVVAKKDIPMEAIKDPEVGYWSGVAGPAPRLEQREMAIIRNIPQLVMDEIAQNNNHDLIAHFLYAYIDFWCVVLKHWIIWLACIFWYGYLCILKPTIIVGESSKLYNILRLLPPRAIFRDDLTEEEFDAFLDGNFNMAFLRQLIVVGIKEKEWDDYALPPTDYIHSVGLPIIQAYGPFAHQWALYIPKMHPYAPYHIQSLRNQMIDCDRCVRLMIELSLQIVGEAAPIPQGASRKACLTEVRVRIMQEASRLGLLSMLNDAKARLAQANKGFVGARSIAARARTTEEIAQGIRKDYTVAGRPQRGDILAKGAKGSKERRDWVIEVINELRDQLEIGICIGLLACPRQFPHGTLQHAEWLFHDCGQGAEVINSASGYSQTKLSSEPTPAEEMRLQALSDATGAAVILPENMTIDPAAAVRIFSLTMKDRKNDKVYLCKCPYCAKRWLVNDHAGWCAHDCLEVRKKILPGLAAHIQARTTLDMQIQDEAQDDAVQELSKKSGVTRCVSPVSFEWSVGERLNTESEVFTTTRSKKSNTTRRPNKTAAPWERAIDERGRLCAASLERQRIVHLFDLLALPEGTSLLQTQKTDKGEILVPIPMEGYIFTTVKDHLSAMKSPPTLNTQQLAKASATWIVSQKDSKKAEEAKDLQVKAFAKASPPEVKAPEFDIHVIMAAAEMRMTLNRLRPYHYDVDRMLDLLPSLLLSRLSASSLNTSIAASGSSSTIEAAPNATPSTMADTDDTATPASPDTASGSILALDNSSTFYITTAAPAAEKDVDVEMAMMM